MEKSDYRILLVSFYNEEAYGLRALHSILHAKGYTTKMLFIKMVSRWKYDNYEDQREKSIGKLHSFTQKEEGLLKEFIAEYNPNVIGFSLVSSHFWLYKKVYKLIRGMGDFEIVLGGWQPSLNPDECLSYCDMLCVGEGEDAFPELIDRLMNKLPVEDVENIYFQEGDKIIRNNVRSLAGDLSSYPVPIFSNELCFYIENDELVNEDPYMTNTRYGTFIGRGCPYSCTYCSNSYMLNNLYPGEWSKIRYRTLDHVMNELSVVKKKLRNVERINFYDEVFTPRKKWISEFAGRYRKEIGLPFYCFFFPGTCSDEMCGFLKDAGLHGVWLGIQSGSERIRNEVFKRHYSNEKILKQARIFSDHGVSCRYDIILDNPFETFGESLETIRLLLQLPEPFSLNLFSLKYFPNTEITNKALKAGLIGYSDTDDQSTTDHDSYQIVYGKYGKYKAEDTDRQFINDLCMYISFLSIDSKLGDEKRRIFQLIDDYCRLKNIGPVKELLNPYLFTDSRCST